MFSPVRLLRFFLARVVLLAENLALRQQLAVLLRQQPRPRLRRRNRLFWVFLSRWFSGWRDWLVLVKPETVIGWHRRGFRLFWRWKSGGRTRGRPTISRELIALIRRMAKENGTWGAPRVRAEFHCASPAFNTSRTRPNIGLAFISGRVRFLLPNPNRR